MIRLMLADDHKVVRIGLASLFSTVPGIKVVAEAASGDEAVAEARRTYPDVVLMDVRMPDAGDGVVAARAILSDLPTVRVIMLTSYPDNEAVLASIMAGAAGYLLKQTDPEQLIAAVQKVAAGGCLLDPEVTAVAMHYIRTGSSSVPFVPLSVLSEQERRILNLIAAGFTNREIGLELEVSPHTVKTHVSGLLRKLHIGSRSQAAAYLTRAAGG